MKLMKSHCLAIMLFILGGFKTEGQCVLSPIQPSDMFTIDQLWNVVLSGSMPAGQYAIRLQIINGRKTLYQADSKPFMYRGRSLVINQANAYIYQPINLSYVDANFQSSLNNTGGIVPKGKYTVEFSLLKVNRNGAEAICETSYRIQAVTLENPLQLLFVHREDTIRETCPTFGWLPPYPLPAGDYNYELVLTECNDGQLPFDATKKNAPLYKQEVGKGTTKNLCGEIAGLEPGKTYAWTVNINTGGKFEYGTESWRFYYEPEDSVSIIEPEQYYVMSRTAYASFAVIDSNLLPIMFNEDYNVVDSIVSIVLYDSAMNIYAEGEDILLAYNNGTNFNYLNFCNYDFELVKGMYLLEIKCINEKTYDLRFKNSSELTDCY